MRVVVLVTQVTLRALRRAFWVITFRDVWREWERERETDRERRRVRWNKNVIE